MATSERSRKVTPILVDTGFLVALYDKREPMHGRSIQVYDSLVQPLATCEAVVSEALSLLRHLPAAVNGILASIDQGILEIPFVLAESAGAVKTLMAKYEDTPCDFADACLIHMADALNTPDILTLDSDFKHYRWRRNRSFRMLVPLD
jgi:predicted nucleic acid-binding protein